MQSFQNGVLTILLNGGSTTVSGMVNHSTELECMAAEESSGVHQDGDGGSGSGDNGGSGSGDNGGIDDAAQTTTGQSSGGDQATQENQTEANDPTETEANEPTETEATEPGDNGNETENDAAESCSTLNLTPGAKVREAELRISSAGSVWSKVELGS